MKKKKFLLKSLLCLLSAVCFAACGEGNDFPGGDPGNNGGNGGGDDGGSGETLQAMTLTSSPAGSVVLNKEIPDEDIITFSWTAPVKDLSEEYTVSYVTYLDVEGNDYGDQTAVRTEEPAAVMSKTYTSAQLQELAYDRWSLPDGETFTIQFKVVAEWTGGQKTVTPEEKYLNIAVTPFATEPDPVFEADRILLGGSAVGGDITVEVSRTAENENLYAILIDLGPGELLIPLEITGETDLKYLIPAGGTGAADGQAASVTTGETAASWTIPATGRYRVVINMETDRVTVYSPDNDLQPKMLDTEDWSAIGSWGSLQDNPYSVKDIWFKYYTSSSAPDGSGKHKGECSVSEADPQLFIYRGDAVKAGMSVRFMPHLHDTYGTYDFNAGYTLSCMAPDGSARNLTLDLGTSHEMVGSEAGNNRGSYFIFSADPNMIIFDLRNMTVVAKNVAQ